MNIELGSVKGFPDYLGQESQRREAVKKVVQKNFAKYGFTPIETAVMEFDESMRPDILEGEDETISSRFRLKDRAGRNLGLRYEFTFQLARILKQYPEIKLPTRISQIGQVFRDEPIGPDRLRQITQCDADIIGDPTMLAEAECLAVLDEILKELKIEAEIHVNNKRLLVSIIESVEISNHKEVIKELSKKDTIGEDMVKINLKKYADSNQILTLMKLLEKDFAFFKQNAFEGVEELENLITLSKKYGVNLKFNPLLIRGLPYYTGNVFEAIAPGRPALAGGGRYAKLIGKYLGRDLPSVGISLGLDRIAQLAKIEPEITKAIVISLEKEAMSLVMTLRSKGISCLPSLENINKSLELANARKIPYAIFIGEDEIKKGKYRFRDMSTGKDKLLTLAQIIEEFAEED